MRILCRGGDQILRGVADDEADGGGHQAYLDRLQQHAHICRLAKKMPDSWRSRNSARSNNTPERERAQLAHRAAVLL